MNPRRASNLRRKPVIAVSMGDYNGIGPEIVLKSLTVPAIRRICTPVAIGSLEVFEYYARRSKLKMSLHEIEAAGITRSPGGVCVLNVSHIDRTVISPGTAIPDAGRHAGEALQKAVTLCLNGDADAMVTGPTSKETMNNAGYRYPGQTEMIAALAGTSSATMMLVAGKFRVALTTVHLPLRDVSRALSPDLIDQKLSALHGSLRKDFNIRRPHIAVLGLNPHAGEHGLFGEEESKIIAPAISRAQTKGIDAEGPFPSDGFFGTRSHRHYDAVLAMYHDQGLIPLKLTGFDIGVNYSAGLSIVRTSPDHGTAYEIAGKGVANPRSMIEAIKLAVTIAENRRRTS